MILRQAGDVIDIPTERVWQWVKDFENIIFAIPRIELLDLKSDREAVVKGFLFPDYLPISLPEELAVAEAEMVEVNESEKYTRTITENEVFRIQSYLECENISKNETKINMAAKISFRGKSGRLLEKIITISPIIKVISGTQIEEILENLGINLKEHTRKFWREELEKKTKELQSFVYTVSHDLQTPLMSIRGFSDTIYDEFGDELDEDGLHYLNRVQANVEKMSDFIDDLLELSRIGSKDVDTERVDSDEVTGEVISDLSTKLEENDISVEIENELPVISFERNRLYQIFSNLISNSCKYIGNPEDPEIRIGADEGVSSWIFWVHDNGIGIEEENQDAIFELFDRERRVDQEGTGIGLAIVKRILEKYDGKIWVESEKGEYCKFYFQIPKNKNEC